MYKYIVKERDTGKRVLGVYERERWGMLRFAYWLYPTAFGSSGGVRAYLLAMKKYIFCYVAVLC